MTRGRRHRCGRNRWRRDDGRGHHGDGRDHRVAHETGDQGRAVRGDDGRWSRDQGRWGGDQGRRGLGSDQARAVVRVVEVVEVTWSDGSLGCPQPGVNYTQALANGQRVVLAAGGMTYEYHSGPNRPLFYCSDPRPPVGGGGAGAGDS